MKIIFVLLVVLSINLSYRLVFAKTNVKDVVVDDITDYKDLKKILRTKNNVLMLFVQNVKETQSTIKIFRDAAEVIKGQGTMILLDCSNSDVKKICKKLKVTPNPFIIKHFKDGDFHKNYDRQIAVTSFVNFMRDPTGDLPWEEDPVGVDVLHIPDHVSLGKYIKKETRPMLVMFYAPWCGFCKTLKPEFSAAATELKNKYVLAAIDVNRPENAVIRKLYNITGFPTLLYFEGGKMKYIFDAENNKAGIIGFMNDPSERTVVRNKEADWASDTTSEIVHLTDNSFGPALKEENSVLVMFYAPWCGHCKRLKPEYEKAAVFMRDNNIPGILAAIDVTREPKMANKYGVKGYPTLKYFVNGEFQFDISVRESTRIIEFMKNPSEPIASPPPETPWDEEESNVMHLNDENFKTFLKKKKHVLVMFYAPWCGHCKNTKPEFVKTADHFQDDPKIELAAVDCTKHQTLCKLYSVEGYPTIKYFSYLKNVKEYNGGRTEQDFIKFLNDPVSAISTSSEEKKKIAEPFGEYTGSDELLILSDSLFDEQIKNEKRLLIMFYAPWCGHCTAMKPAYAKAAKTISENGYGKLGVLDCTVNVKVQEKYKIKGFPTIKYFENGIFKEDYTGPRTTESFVEFIRRGGSYLKKDEF